MKPFLFEMLGTFFLVFVIAISSGNVVAAAAILAIMIYAGGPVSGGHFNPAVTLGVTMLGKLSVNKMWQYWTAQFLGSLIAVGLVHLMSGVVLNVARTDSATLSQAFIVEFIFTFSLVLTVLMTAYHKVAPNSYFGIAIALNIVVAAYTVGPVSGAILNPALGMIPTLYRMATGSVFQLDNVFLYAAAPLLGGLCAAGFSKLVMTEEHSHSPKATA